MNLQEEFPEIWNLIINKKIPRNEIDKFLLEFHLKLLEEIKKGKRDPWSAISLNDFWQIVVSSGYKLNPEVEDYILRLVDFDPENPKPYYEISYIDAPSDPVYSGNLENIEKRAKELLVKIIHK